MTWTRAHLRGAHMHGAIMASFFFKKKLTLITPDKLFNALLEYRLCVVDCGKIFAKHHNVLDRHHIDSLPSPGYHIKFL